MEPACCAKRPSSPRNTQKQQQLNHSRTTGRQKERMKLLHAWSFPRTHTFPSFHQLHISPPRSAGDAAASSCATHRKDDEGCAGTRNWLRRGWGVSRRYFSEEKNSAPCSAGGWGRLEGGRGRRGRPGRAATQTVRRHAAAAAADRGDLSVLQRHWLRWEGARSRPRAGAVRGPCTVAQSPQSTRGKRPVGQEDFFFFLLRTANVVINNIYHRRRSALRKESCFPSSDAAKNVTKGQLNQESLERGGLVCLSDSKIFWKVMIFTFSESVLGHDDKGPFALPRSKHKET